MADFPYLPIVVASYLADTRHLTTRDHGRLMLLLMGAWSRENDPVPTQEELSRFSLRREVCRRFVRYEIHPSNWPDGRWCDVREAVFARDGKLCAYCGSTKGPFDIDHIFPRSRGGGNEAANLTVACSTCNRSKGARTPDEWRCVQ